MTLMETRRNNVQWVFVQTMHHYSYYGGTWHHYDPTWNESDSPWTYSDGGYYWTEYLTKQGSEDCSDPVLDRADFYNYIVETTDISFDKDDYDYPDDMTVTIILCTCSTCTSQSGTSQLSSNWGHRT